MLTEMGRDTDRGFGPSSSPLPGNKIKPMKIKGGVL
jgi:hypothetical protein